MMSKNDGGPAFAAGTKPQQVGMSLRDYFAAEALAGVIFRGTWHGRKTEAFAQEAYEYADAMLAERNKDNG